MPGFDGTGPAGMGPMTGGARGYCNPYAANMMGGYGYPGAYGPAPAYPAYGYRPPMYGYGYGYGPPAYGYGPYAGGYPQYGVPAYGYHRFGMGRGPCGGGMAWGRRAGGGRWW